MIMNVIAANNEAFIWRAEIRFLPCFIQSMIHPSKVEKKGGEILLYVLWFSA
jgi:hypothetical protein